jgi:hypothetical protein
MGRQVWMAAVFGLELVATDVAHSGMWFEDDWAQLCAA